MSSRFFEEGSTTYVTLEKGQSLYFDGGLLYEVAGLQYHGGAQSTVASEYKVGYDLPVGTVTLYPLAGESVYSIFTSSSLTKSSVVQSARITAPTRVQLKKGQYLFIDRIQIQ